jgi:hypothetical protein
MAKKIIRLDASQLTAFSICPQMWHLKYQEQLRKSTGDRLQAYADKGTIIHLFLESFYTLRGLEPRMDRIAHGNAAMGLVKDSKVCELLPKSERELIFERMFQYVIFYSNGDFTPVRRGHKVATEVGFSKVLYENKEVIYVIEGKIDMLAKLHDLEGIIFVDHKSQARRRNYYNYTVQFLTYAWATGARYGCYNYFGLQKENKKNDVFRRGELISFSDGKLEEFKDWAIDIFSEIECILDLDDSETTKNFSACEGKFGFPCSYTELCEETDPVIFKNKKENAYHKVERWEPWSLEEEK